MILIEHATVLTVDAERRILVDGSVPVDGRREHVRRAGVPIESVWPVVP
jgi:hypothetical protein